MGKIENKDEEVVEIKNKYKKLRKRILIILLIIVFTFLVSLTIKTIKVQDLLKANLSSNLGNNYKIIRSGFGEGTKYVKDDIVLQKNGRNGILSYDGKGYVILYELKEYQELELELQIFSDVNITIMDFLTLSENEVNSFIKMAEFVLLENVKLNEDKINDKECYTLSCNNSSVKIWFDKESKILVKEEYSGSTSLVNVEIGTVTDEDVKLPWQLGFSKK